MSFRPMAAKKTSKSPNKSDFIRSVPLTMPAADLVAKAKSEGIAIKVGLVYEVRRGMRAKTGSPATAKPATASAVAKTPKKSETAGKTASARTASPTASTLSKAELIRSLLGVSVEEVRTQARAAELYLAEEKSKAGTPRSTSELTSRVEDLLKAVAAELGLGRAIEILTRERARVRAVIGEA